jgi:hypothetical protein
MRQHRFRTFPATCAVLFATAAVPSQANDLYCAAPGPDYLLCDGFEGATSVIDESLDGSTSSIVGDVSHGGDWSVEMDNSEDGLFSERHYLQDAGGDPVAEDVLYARYMFRVGDADSSCWDPNQHYKNMGFEGGTTDCKGGDHVSDGTDCFTVRTRFNWPHIGFRIEGFMGVGNGTVESVNEDVDVADGAWHCFEMRVKLNDPESCEGYEPPDNEDAMCNAGGPCDGEVRYWVDGQETVCGNLYFRTVESLKIDKWWFTYWANDDWCGPLYVDDLVVSRSRIGCPGEAASEPPSPPTGLIAF